MIAIIYKTKHGSTRKIAKVLDAYLDNQCLLMDFDKLDMEKLKEASTIVIGVNVYYGVLNSDVIDFIYNNQAFLIERHYSIYVVNLLYREFMTYLTKTFNYDILKNITIMKGLGGALYYPELSMYEKLILAIMNKRVPIIPKDTKEIFENFHNEEIALFASKIKKIEEKNTKSI